LSALIESGPEIIAAIRDVRTITLPKVNTGLDKASSAIDNAGSAFANANTTINTYRETGETATEFIKHLRSFIEPAMQRYNGVAESAKNALAQIAELFGETKGDFRTTVANLRDATGTVKERLPGIADKVESLLTDITKAVASTNVALEDVKRITENTRDATASVRSIVVSNRGKIDGMITSLKATGDNLKNASAEVRRSPWRLLYKPPPGEVANLNLYDSARQFADGAGHLNDAALALRDALQDPDVEPAHVQKLVEKLDQSFTNFGQIEQELWRQVKP
jgi:ABC-type transporter Mla subunit MlaD